jgi:hypothetical protein
MLGSSSIRCAISVLLLFTNVAVLAVAASGEGQELHWIRELQQSYRSGERYSSSSSGPVPLCRCLAPWEEFPGLRQRHLVENKDSSSAQDSDFGRPRHLQPHYDYSQSEYNAKTGAILIEGVRVLPDTNAACRGGGVAANSVELATKTVDGIFSKQQHGNNRNLLRSNMINPGGKEWSQKEKNRELQNYHDSSDSPRLRPSPLGECSTYGTPGSIPTCCFSLCQGTEGGGIRQPSGTECAACDCDCPEIPRVFECPRDIVDTTTPSSILNDACQVAVTVDCTVPGSTGLRCGELEPLSSLTCNCPGDDACPVGYDFIYTGNDCHGTLDDGVVSCFDSNAKKPAKVRIVVRGGGQQLFNGVVLENEPIYVLGSGSGSSSSCIPERLQIEVTSATDFDVVYQVVVVNTQCNANGLWLGDSVGAFQFTGFFCQDATALTTCLETVRFEVCALNEKNLLAPFDLTRLDLDVNGVKSNMLRRKNSAGVVQNLAKRHCASEWRSINICNDLSFVATATADGDDGGNGCSETAIVEFKINGPDASTANGGATTCDMDVTVDCTVWDGTGTKCEDMEPETSIVCNCNGNQAGGYDFKYTGDACPTISQQDGVEYCSDFNGDKPDLVRVVVTDDGGGNTQGSELYSGTIRTGRTILLREIPDRIRIDVTSLNSNTVYQTVMVNTRCDNSGT